MIARNIAVDPNYTGYIEDGVCIIFEDLGDEICKLHVYCDEKHRGKTFVNLLRSLESELIGRYKEVLMEPPSLPKIHRLIKLMGVPEVEPGIYSYKIGATKVALGGN